MKGKAVKHRLDRFYVYLPHYTIYGVLLTIIRKSGIILKADAGWEDKNVGTNS